MALWLSGLGVYAVLSTWVAQRGREIGVRMAIGATPRAVTSLVVRSAAAPVAAGVGAGLVGAFGLTRFLRALLYGVTPLDPAVLSGAVLALFAVAGVAAWLPASRAARLDPVVAMRQD